MMGEDYALNEMLSSMESAVAELHRHILRTAIKGTASRDMRNDMVRTAQRIAELAARIPE